MKKYPFYSHCMCVCVSVNNNLFYKIFLSIYNRVNFIDIFNWLSRNPIDILLERERHWWHYLFRFVYIKVDHFLVYLHFWRDSTVGLTSFYLNSLYSYWLIDFEIKCWKYIDNNFCFKCLFFCLLYMFGGIRS